MKFFANLGLTIVLWISFFAVVTCIVIESLRLVDDEAIHNVAGFHFAFIMSALYICVRLMCIFF